MNALDIPQREHSLLNIFFETQVGVIFIIDSLLAKKGSHIVTEVVIVTINQTK